MYSKIEKLPNGGEKLIGYLDNGKVKCEAYRLNGKLHREDEPAYIEYDDNEKVYYKEYYLNGNNLSEAEFKEYKKSLDSKKAIKGFLE